MNIKYEEAKERRRRLVAWLESRSPAAKAKLDPSDVALATFNYCLGIMTWTEALNVMRPMGED